MFQSVYLCNPSNPVILVMIRDMPEIHVGLLTSFSKTQQNSKLVTKIRHGTRKSGCSSPSTV